MDSATIGSVGSNLYSHVEPHMKLLTNDTKCPYVIE